MSEVGVRLRLHRHLHEHIGGGRGVHGLAETREQVEGYLPAGLRVARGIEGPLEALDALIEVCLLYTSDAAGGRSSGDPGGRRIIKKKEEQKKKKEE